jgi:hypothetical protein
MDDNNDLDDGALALLEIFKKVSDEGFDGITLGQLYEILGADPSELDPDDYDKVYSITPEGMKHLMRKTKH